MSIEFGIRGILNTLPVLSQTSVALEKIESLGLSLAEPVSEPDFPTGSDFELVGRCFASSLSNQASDWTSLELVDIHHAY